MSLHDPIWTHEISGNKIDIYPDRDAWRITNRATGSGGGGLYFDPWNKAEVREVAKELKLLAK